MRLLFIFLLLLLPLAAQPLSREDVLSKMPEYEAYVEKARVDWEVPQVAVAVIHEDEIVWWKGFGENPPDQNTVFAIGSTTKAFAATTLAMMVDREGAAWDSKVADAVPGFAMYDPWVTREMQVDDLLAQHSGMAQQALSALGAMGYSRERIQAAMRWSKPVTSFRSRYAYVNSPHLVAGEMVKRWSGENSWEAYLSKAILKPLGMESTTWTAEGLDQNPNSARGHSKVEGKVKPIAAGPFPYVFGPAGALNSNLHDMARWVRFQIHNGVFEGNRLVSETNLQVTRSPHTIVAPNVYYGMGWLQLESNGRRITWHNGGTPGHTTFVGISPEEKVGVVILSNLGGTQMPDAAGLRLFDLLRGFDGPDFNKAFLSNHKTPTYPPVLKTGFLAEMAGEYEHPALGTIRVGPEGKVHFYEVDLHGELRPIGPNLFELNFSKGWLNDIGWGRLGQALFAPDGISETASFTFYLGDPGEGTAFKAHRTSGP